MTKSELIDGISGKTGIPKVDVIVALDCFFKDVKDTVERGDSVYIRGFGSFVPKKRARKLARNIKKNVAIVIPEHHVPAFRPAENFIEMVKNSRHLRKSKSA